MFREKVGSNFPFSAYLAYCVAEGVAEAIEVHEVTWIVLIILFGTFACVHRFAKVGLYECTLVFLAVAFVLIAIMAKYIRVEKREIQRFMQTFRSKKEHRRQSVRMSYFNTMSPSKLKQQRQSA